MYSRTSGLGRLSQLCEGFGENCAQSVASTLARKKGLERSHSLLDGAGEQTSEGMTWAEGLCHG